MKKALLLMAVMGLVYMDVEISYGAITALKWPLIGQSSLWMMLEGGLLCYVLGLYNEKGCIAGRLSYRACVLLGAVTIIGMELVSGIILNKWLGFGIWDYSSARFNFLGQIDLVHSICWLLITPMAFWLDDVMRHYMFAEERPESIATYYKGAFWL